MSFNFEIIKDYWQLIISGMPLILALSLIAALLGTSIGLATVFLRKKGFLFEKIVAGYIDIFRGTPVYVQLAFFYFGLPSLFPGLNISAFVSAFVIFSLNSGAYLSEIIRAGVENIDKGQIEAAKALGVSKTDIAKDIILPLAFRNVLPAVVNEFITLTKETAIVSVIGLHDMMYYNNAVNSKFYSMFEPMLVVFIAYYLMNKVLSFMGKLIERKLKYD
ncbi:amino acid ABC transporter permease [Amedibacillus sp. YH-ame10]